MQTEENTIVETADDIQQHIKELQNRLKTLELADEPEIEKVTLPLANVHLRRDKTLTIWKQAVTPPELQLLIAIHHSAAGEMPVLEIKLMPRVRAELEAQADAEQLPSRKEALRNNASQIPDSISVDPRLERNRLIGIYGSEKVNALFPGSDPKLPKTFKRAMDLGVDAPLTDKKLFAGRIPEHRLFNTEVEV